jgi:hypothetical protein
MDDRRENRILKSKIASLQRKVCCDKKAVESSITTYTITLDGVVVETFTLPTMSDKTINITLV